jgi:parvulin-like peptidyl-prolyl isomerase
VRSRLRSLIAVSLIALGASGCSTLTGSDLTVGVNGQGVTTEEADALLAEYFAESEIFGTTPLDAGGFGDADRARLILNALVRSSAVASLLAPSGDEITDADLDLYFSTVPSESPLNELSDEMRRLIATTSAEVLLSALSRVELPTAEELEATYSEQPIATGMLCLRHILVATEEEANDVVASLEDGVDFVTIATQVSLEGSAALTGGALTGTESECLPTAQYISNFDPDFVAAAFEAPATTWSEPVKTQFGWHVILNRPWAEIGDDVVAAYASPDGALFYVDAVLNSADVTVDSRFGRWNPSSGRIVPLG